MIPVSLSELTDKKNCGNFYYIYDIYDIILIYDRAELLELSYGIMNDKTIIYFEINIVKFPHCLPNEYISGKNICINTGKEFDTNAKYAKDIFRPITPEELCQAIHKRYFRHHVWEKLMAAACHPSRLDQIC